MWPEPGLIIQITLAIICAIVKILDELDNFFASWI